MRNLTRSQNLFVLFLAICGILAGSFAATLYFKPRFNKEDFHGTWLEHAREVNQFKLESTDNESFSNANLKGKWTFIFFGFTSCGYLCPTTMSELNKMYRVLEEKKVKELPQIVMISVDQENDTLTRLQDYVKAFNPAFMGARGTEESVQKMASEMGIAYAKIVLKDADSRKNYTFEHSGTLIVFNPKGELKAFFTTPHHANMLAKDYLMLIS